MKSITIYSLPFRFVVRARERGERNFIPIFNSTQSSHIHILTSWGFKSSRYASIAYPSIRAPSGAIDNRLFSRRPETSRGYPHQFTQWVSTYHQIHRYALASSVSRAIKCVRGFIRAFAQPFHLSSFSLISHHRASHLFPFSRPLWHPLICIAGSLQSVSFISCSGSFWASSLHSTTTFGRKMFLWAPHLTIRRPRSSRLLQRIACLGGFTFAAHVIRFAIHWMMVQEMP